MNNIPIYKCQICSKEYACQNDLDSHILLHTNENKYNLSPKICVECNNPISYDKRHNKTCSRLCSALQGNKNRDKRSQESLNKSRQSRLKYIKENIILWKDKPLIDLECIICDNM
jgi:uncharacterized CHY-type Zn-finger protein